MAGTMRLQLATSVVTVRAYTYYQQPTLSAGWSGAPRVGTVWTEGMTIDGNSQRQLSAETGKLSMQSISWYRHRATRVYHDEDFETNGKSRSRGETHHDWKTTDCHVSTLRYDAACTRCRPRAKGKVDV